MLSKKIVVMLFVCVIVAVLFMVYWKNSSTVDSVDLAKIIDVDLSPTNKIFSQKVFRDEVKDNGEYKIYKVLIPSFYSVGDNFEEFQLLMQCYLFLYKDSKTRPGILVVPGNGPGIESTAGFVDDYENKSALYLANAGYNVLTCDNLGFEKHSVPISPDKGILRESDSVKVGRYKFNLPPKILPALFNKTTLIGTIVQDQLQALQFLKSLPSVAKIGVAGTSLGGMVAIYLAVFDKDVSGVISMGFFNKFASLPAEYHWGWYDFDADWPKGKMLTITSLVAPRNALYVAGEKDLSQPITESLKLFASLKLEYSAVGAEENVSFVSHDGGHIWKNDVALQFFDKILKN